MSRFHICKPGALGDDNVTGGKKYINENAIFTGQQF